MTIKIKKGNTNLDSGVNDRVNRHEHMIYAVILVLLFMVVQFLLEYFRFSSTVYKEYSQKTESVETVQKINEDLLKEIKELSEQSKEDRDIIKQLLKK